MKKIVYFLLFALCLPIGLMAQSVDDDLYFVPSKDKQEKKETPVKKEPKKQVTTNIYTSPGTTVVVQDRKGRTRDVDEYNRRYDARENEFVMDNDTLYIKEKSQPDLDGEWVTGEFDGTQEDYEYAERIIRFRNPRFAISISSPLYWDVVYGPNSWDWNVYTDGLYAYAFPTFSNPLWWNWRYSPYSWGWNYGWGWNRPYYSWGYSPGYWGGYWGGFYGGGGYWGHHHHWGSPSWGWGGGGNHWARNTYTNRRSYGYNNFSSSRRNGAYSDRRSAIDTGRRSSSGSSIGRTVGTRREATRVGTGRTGVTTRGEASSTRRSSNYTRPSSTRSSSNYNSNREGTVRRSATPTRSSSSSSSGTVRRSSSTYNRGTSTSSPATRSSSRSSTTRSYDSSTRSSSSSSRSTYSPSSSSSSRSGGSYSGGGSSSRSSGGGGGSSRSGRR